MDCLLAIDWLQAVAAPGGQINCGLHHCWVTRCYVVEKSRGGEIHNDPMAVRVYLHATCLVSVGQAPCQYSSES